MTRFIFALLMLCSVAAAADKPNFLFVFTDDQRWDAMSVVQREQGERARFPWLKTPNMDRLAAEGFRFRNAFVVNSLCAPCRATYLTGQYGHFNGVVNNHTPFPVDNITHSTELRKIGYATAYIGKWHMGGQIERPNFDFSASFIGQGKYFDCPIYINGKETPSAGWVDDVTTEYAGDFIRKNKDRPFCVTMAYKSTHGPFQPPPRREKDYEGETARPAPNLKIPAIYKAPDGKPVKQSVTDAAPAQGDIKTNLGYFRCITAADDNLGKLLKLLDELKIADNTLVIFSSDNGYYLGEHGLGDKRSGYEESLRIPLLVRYPKLGGGNKLIDQMALNVDLAPTLLDFAGAPIPKAMQGRSWKPLLEGKAPADWRKAWFYCYFFERNFGTPTVTAVRTETHKLIKYPGYPQWSEMFDIVNDPYELKNLINEPAHADLRRQLEAEYDKQAAAVHFKIPDYADKPGDAPLDSKKNKKAGKKAAGGKKAGKAGASGAVSEYRFDQTQSPGTLVAGRDGKQAHAFTGSASLPVANAPDPSGGPFAVKAAVRADKPDGVIVAHGGRSEGYCLFVKNGRPGFAVTAAGKPTIITADQAVAGKWVQLAAAVTADRQMTLSIDGQAAASAPLPKFITKDPNDGLTIGADEKTTVMPDSPPPFTGLIESLQITRGSPK